MPLKNALNVDAKRKKVIIWNNQTFGYKDFSGTKNSKKFELEEGKKFIKMKLLEKFRQIEYCKFFYS